MPTPASRRSHKRRHHHGNRGFTGAKVVDHLRVTRRKSRFYTVRKNGDIVERSAKRGGRKSPKKSKARGRTKGRKK